MQVSRQDYEGATTRGMRTQQCGFGQTTLEKDSYTVRFSVRDRHIQC